VVTGGHYDVDVVLTDPLKNVLYKEERQHDVFGQENENLFIFSLQNGQTLYRNCRQNFWI
jgi:hypothetical protein